MIKQNFDNYAVEYDHIVNDVTKISKIGRIISIEIDLDPIRILSNEIIKFCRNHDGIYHIFSSIFINYDLIDNITFNHFMKMLVEDTESIINNIIVQVYSKFRGYSMTYNLGLSPESEQPMILSVSDQFNYFNFLHMFQFLWQSTK